MGTSDAMTGHPCHVCGAMPAFCHYMTGNGAEGPLCVKCAKEMGYVREEK